MDVEKQEPEGNPVCLIMVTHNGACVLPRTLRSFKASTMYPHRLMAVDNASTDDTVDIVKSLYPDAIVERLDENVGYGGALNAGFRRSRSIGFTYHCLLNQDLEPSPGWLGVLVEAQRRSGGVVGPPLRGAEVNGSVLLVSNEILDRVGDFCDELYFMYGEDNDFIRRCNFMGVSVVAVPECGFSHDARSYRKHREILPWLCYGQFMLALTNPTRPFVVNIALPGVRFMQIAHKALTGREWTDPSVIPLAARELARCIGRWRAAREHWREQRMRKRALHGP